MGKHILLEMKIDMLVLENWLIHYTEAADNWDDSFSINIKIDVGVSNAQISLVYEYNCCNILSLYL
jgi:hypothetical protein